MNYFKHDHALIEKGAVVGADTRVWAFAHILDGAVIGSGCNICDGCYVERGAVLGDRVTLKNNVAVFGGVTLEENVFVGANVSFINDRHPRCGRDWTLEKVLVKQGASIGAGAVIMAGVTIGKYAMVGAGAVVTKDVPNHALVVGNPAKLVGYVSGCGRKLDEHLRSVKGTQYCLTDEGVERMEG